MPQLPAPRLWIEIKLSYLAGKLGDDSLDSQEIYRSKSGEFLKCVHLIFFYIY